MVVELRIGDSRKLIKEIPNKSIDCVMTSPPYWGLRDYGHFDQIGLEPTPEEYLKTLLDFFDDVKLKLKDEGNCFVNLGDTYNGSGNGNNWIDPKNKDRDLTGQKPEPTHYDGIPKKCLCMIPQRFAWGMIERGWILRNEIIWAKPNHMPESVTDRLTKAHEVIWHFVKQGKYYYNLDAIREPFLQSSIDRCNKTVQSLVEKYQGKFEGNGDPETFGSPRARTQRKGNTGCRTQDCLHYDRGDINHPNGKNPGDVWNITTQAYPESHFAVFPLELVRRPILAGCPIGGTVLDPFGGSGTVGEFCRHNDRNAILFELNPAYKPLIEDRAMLKIKELGAWA